MLATTLKRKEDVLTAGKIIAGEFVLYFVASSSCDVVFVLLQNMHDLSLLQQFASAAAACFQEWMRRIICGAPCRLRPVI